MSNDIVKRQGSKSLLVNIISVVLGLINNVFIYPLFLGLYGTFQMVSNLLRLLSPFSLFGLSSVINKYFSEYSDRGNDFLVFILKWFSLSFLVFTTLYFFALPYFIDFLTAYFPFVEIIKINSLAIYITTLMYSLCIIFNNISYTNKRIVVPSLIYKVISLKIIVPIVIVLAHYFSFSTEKLLWLVAGIYSINFISILAYVGYNKWLSNSATVIHEKTKLSYKMNFGAFGSFNELGMYLAFSIDILLIYFLLGDIATGFYAVFFFLASVVRIPIDSLNGLFLPMVNTLLKNNDYDKIHDYYKRLSKIFLFLCCGIFLVIYISIQDILQVIGQVNLINAKYIFTFVSLGIIINGATYMNSLIIIQSDYYRWNIVFILILAVFNVFFSYILITKYFPIEYQSAGAACGTAISLAVYNLLKVMFIYVKFKLHPFSKSTVIIFIIFLLAFFLCSQIDFGFVPLVNICLYSLLVAVIYFTPIYILKEVKDINDFLKAMYLKIAYK